MNGKRIKVLLIEDNPGDVRLIREMLSEDSRNVFEIVHSDQLSKGLECLKGDGIDVILLDLGLPDSQGIDTLYAVLFNNNKIPIIVQTGLSDEELAIEAVKAGAQDYLIKRHINSYLLSRSIRYAIERKRIKEELRDSEERLKTLYQESPIPTFTWQKRGDDFYLIDFNLAAVRITGNNVCNYLDKSAESLYKNKPQILEDMRQCFTEHSVIRRDVVSKLFYPGKYLSVHYAFVSPDLIIVHADDQTDRKKAEEALQNSEAKYRFLTERMNDIVWTLNMNLQTTYVSPSVEKILGFTPEERMSQNVIDQITPSSLARIQKQLLDELQHEKKGYTDPNRSVKIEVEYYHKDGSVVWMENNVSGIRDKDGKVMGLLGLSRDITERKKAELMLSELERHLEEIILFFPDPTMIIDHQGKVTAWNYAMEELTGVKAEDMLGKGNYEYALPFYGERRPILIDIAIKQDGKIEGGYDFVTWHGNTISGENYITHLGSEKEYFQGSATALYNSRGEIIGAIESIRNITERKRMENLIKENERRLNFSIQTSEMGIWELNVLTGEAWRSLRHDQIFGYETLLPKWTYEMFIEHVIPEDRNDVDDKFHNALLAGTTWEFECNIRRRDGAIRWIWAKGNPAEYNDQGKLVIFNGFVQDITDRKQAEEKLRESEERYRELSIVDNLSQLYNSMYFYQQLKIEIERTNRYGQPLTLLLLDLDDFKKINDTYGHLEGDVILSRLGQVIKRCIRQTDSGYRYGGEEFTIIMPMSTDRDGAIMAERIRTEFKKEIFPIESSKKDIHMTVSIGLAQYRPQEDIKAFIHRVDQLMYQAKKNGKDRVCFES